MKKKYISCQTDSPNKILVSQLKFCFHKWKFLSSLPVTNSWHWRLISSTKLHTFYKVAFSKSKTLNWKMAILLYLPYFWVILSTKINLATTSSLGNRLSKHSFSYYLWTGNWQSCLFAICLSSLDQAEIQGSSSLKQFPSCILDHHFACMRYLHFGFSSTTQTTP